MGPKGVTVDHNGHVIVVDNKSCTVFIFQPTGKLISKFGSRGNGDKQFAGISKPANSRFPTNVTSRRLWLCWSAHSRTSRRHLMYWEAPIKTCSRRWTDWVAPSKTQTLDGLRSSQYNQ